MTTVIKKYIINEQLVLFLEDINLILLVLNVRPGFATTFLLFWRIFDIFYKQILF